MPEELSRAAPGWRLRMPDVVPGLQVDGARVPVEDLVHETRALLHQHLLGLGAVHDGLEDAADYRVLEYWRIRLNKHCHCTALRRLFSIISNRINCGNNFREASIRIEKLDFER